MSYLGNIDNLLIHGEHVVVTLTSGGAGDPHIQGTWVEPHVTEGRWKHPDLIRVQNEAGTVEYLINPANVAAVTVKIAEA